MVNFDEHKPFHPDPGNVKNMEVDHESNSPVLNTQEADFGAEHGVFPEHTEFIKVNRSRIPHCVRFPTHFFGDKSADILYMRKWVTTTLAEVAPAKQGTFTIAKLLVPSTDSDVPERPDDDNGRQQVVEYLIFNVSSKADVTAACEHGGQKDGNVIHFEAHPYEAQEAQKGRVVKINSLAWNTPVSNIKAAMKEWGEVESVTTAFNGKMTMKEALVLFKSAKSVGSLREAGATCLYVQDDVGTIVQLGTANVTYDPNLTVKLAYLPRYITPADLKHIFDTSIPAPNAASSYHTLTMPIVVGTKRRKPEAYVKFVSREQQARALKTEITIDGQVAIWVNADKYTCHFCGHPDHLQRDCTTLQGIIAREKTRRINAAIIRGVSIQSTPRSSPRTPPTQASQNTATQSTASKQSAPSRPSTRPSSGNSYANIITPSQKNRGSAASNPISIHSTATPAAPRASTAPGNMTATPASVATANAPVNWAQYFKEQIALLDQKHKVEVASVKEDITSLNRKMDRILEELRLPRSGTTSAAPHQVAAESDQDVEFTEVPSSPITVPDSLPSTPSPVATPHNHFQEPVANQDHTAAPPQGTAPYSQLVLRSHPAGGKAGAKSGVEREESEHSRKLPSAQDRNGKAPQRGPVPVTTQDSMPTQSQLLEMIQQMKAQNDELRATIATLTDQSAERELAYRELYDRLNQQAIPRDASQAESEHIVYASMTSTQVREYAGAPFIGSTETTTRPNSYEDNGHGSRQDTDDEL